MLLAASATIIKLNFAISDFSRLSLEQMIHRPRNQLTQAQVSAVVSDKTSLFDSLLRNQLFCPPMKEPIMST